MKYNKISGLFLRGIWITISLLTVSCREDITSEENDPDVLIEVDMPDWSEETHGSSTEPDYSVVFNQDKVQRIDIVIDSENWDIMLIDLQNILGSTGGRPESKKAMSEGMSLPPPPPLAGNDTDPIVEIGAPPIDVPQDQDYDPVWVSCNLEFNDLEWYKVGIRFKGNSSLSSAYRAGIGKLSFKLDFNQYGDEYSGIADQRFYGFRQFSLKNNYDDESLLREKVASDLFLDFGIASPQTAFYEVYVDFGSGPVYFGLYTLVEEVDDTVPGSQFISSSGNLYKPDGTAASFASGTYNNEEMEKKNNEDLNDYSDVISLYNIINDSERLSDTDSWKNELETILNVDIFLKWLAANTFMQNWDTYGRMTHNYYLYNNPEDGLLTWIPWDNNEALMEGKMGGTLSLSLSEVSSSWPLIAYLMDIPEYESIYKNYLQEFGLTSFSAEKMIPLYTRYYELLKEYAYSENAGYSFLEYDTDFDNAIDELKSHVIERNSLVSSFLE